MDKKTIKLILEVIKYVVTALLGYLGGHLSLCLFLGAFTKSVLILSIIA